MFGFAAIGVSVAFLAFLLITMAWKGPGGFSRDRGQADRRLRPVRLFLDEATLRGPEAQQAVASAGLEGVIEQAAVAQFGEGAGELFGGASVRALGDQLIEDPTLLTKQGRAWIPFSSKADVAAKRDGDPALEELLGKAQTKRVFNSEFLTASDATDASVVGVWGALKGSFLTILVTMALAFPIGVLAALYLEEFAPGIAGPTSSRFRSTISPRFHRSSSDCWAWQCSSTSCTCRVRPRWLAG